MTIERKTTSIERRTHSSRGRRRGGYVLVLVALLLFGLMAMAALVIDIGYARLAQRQMQTATDAAALEGLGYVDSDGRQRASDIVGWTFDDDLELSSNSMNLGAGPVLSFSHPVGAAELHASELMSIPSTPFYRPSGASSLAQNPGDDITGDMVDGYFAFAPPVESTTDKIRAFHGEADDYSRSDFPNPDPDGTMGLELHRAFLVRLRRTGESFDEGIGTSGPTLPYLFGRGSLIDHQLIGSGIKVRATSIASAQPVVCIGGAQGPDGFKSLEIVYEKSMWLANDLSKAVRFEGAILGDPVSVTIPNSTEQGYVGIYDNNLKRVIAFGFVRPGSSGVIEKFRVGSNSEMAIAKTNASPAFLFDLLSTETDKDLSPLERSTIISLVIASRNSLFDELKLMGVAVTAQQVLHAPALVR